MCVPSSSRFPLQTAARSPATSTISGRSRWKTRDRPEPIRGEAENTSSCRQAMRSTSQRAISRCGLRPMAASRKALEKRTVEQEKEIAELKARLEALELAPEVRNAKGKGLPAAIIH